MYVLSAINFLFRTALAVSFKFDTLYFRFHSVQCISKFPLGLPPWPVDYLEASAYFAFGEFAVVSVLCVSGLALLRQRMH